MKILKKLKGGRYCHRNRWLLLREKLLTREELQLLELSVDLADWDITHGESYGSFEATNEELANLLAYKDGSSISRIKRKLISKNLLICKGKLHTIPNIKRYLGKSFSAGMALEFAKQEKDLLPQQIFENMQQQLDSKQNETVINQEELAGNQVESDVLRLKMTPQVLVSSKENSGLFRSDKEYEKIIKEGGYTALTVEDLKWIDVNVKEEF